MCKGVIKTLEFWVNYYIRFMFFEKTKHLAGDIVELGVFKCAKV